MSKPGTNYNHRLPTEALSGWDSLALVAAGEAECRAGRHQVMTVPANRVMYAPYGRRRETGERYCRRCQAVQP